MTSGSDNKHCADTGTNKSEFRSSSDGTYLKMVLHYDTKHNPTFVT